MEEREGDVEQEGGGERNKVKRVEEERWEEKNCGKREREEGALEEVEMLYNSSLLYSVIPNHE